VSSVQCLNGVAMTTYCTEFKCPTDEEILRTANEARKLATNNPPVI
ncbi:MAG: phycobiliprotein lyase, partial [Cyanobacteriota bacterium]|nr:phycobiliprotein lyase [Cyanobacteriota bacterium]